jgi:hypothetical protein
MLRLSLNNDLTEDEAFLHLMASVGEDVDVFADTVLTALDRLFGKADFEDHEEYVVDISGIVPEEPGPARDRMWQWIEKVEKQLGIEVEVWGTGGEYLTPSTGDGRTYGLNDFGQTEDGKYFIETGLAKNLEELAEFHCAWRKFVKSQRRRHDED